jgi:hypothetical protein
VRTRCELRSHRLVLTIGSALFDDCGGIGMVISSSLFDAYIECSTKCWLRSRAEPNTGNAYADWSRQRRETYCVDGLKRLVTMFPESDRAIAPPISKYTKNAAWRLAIDVHLGINGLETHLPAVERIPSDGRGYACPIRPLSFRIRQQTPQYHQAVACVRCARAFRSAWTRGDFR